MRYVGLLMLVSALGACSDPAGTPTPEGPIGSVIFPRQALVIDIDGAVARAGDFMLLAAPADTERVALRSYPGQCVNGQRAPRCDVVAFMWPDGGSASFFERTGDAVRWNATLVKERDERRGMLYVRAGSGASLRDSVARYTTYATVASIRCGDVSCDSPASSRLHGVVQTTDAVKPGDLSE